MRAGRITIPGMFINPALGAVNHLLLYFPLYKDLHRHIHRIRDLSVAKGQLRLVYEWDPQSLEHMHEKGKQFLISQEHQEKLVLYYNKLVQTVRPYKNKKVSLALVLRPMFIFPDNNQKSAAIRFWKIQPFCRSCPFIPLTGD
nr:hypothetical protein [Desulfobacula sp.]